MCKGHNAPGGRNERSRVERQKGIADSGNTPWAGKQENENLCPALFLTSSR